VTSLASVPSAKAVSASSSRTWAASRSFMLMG
jgi:hypothetical protein